MTIAFVFPGQGSQSVGMLSALGEAFPQVGRTFEELSDVLGEDFVRLVREGPEAALNRTENTQPAMLGAGVAVQRVWEAAGGCAPAVLAGHSFGEYTALVAAGALDFATAARLARLRGRLMQEAVPEGRGAMAAVLGLDDAQVQALCEAQAAGQVLEAVNFNAPGQVVVAGEREAVERLAGAAKEAGARRVVILPVSVPAHSSLMREAATRLAEALREAPVSTPRIPVLHNVDVSEHTDPDAIRSVLAAQLHSPVRWVETIQAMRDRGADRILEMGPGKVLTGLTRRIDRSLRAVCVESPEALEQARELCGE
jgi:[acyl-carrier-protein] S-malonyltransferase